MKAAEIARVARDCGQLRQPVLDRGQPQFKALFAGNDPNKRIMVLLNFNTDVSNYWEFSAQGFVPVSDSNEAYELGVNYLVYALTH